MQFELLNGKKKPMGTIVCNSINIVQVPSFLDYLRGGE